MKIVLFILNACMLVSCAGHTGKGVTVSAPEAARNAFPVEINVTQDYPSKEIVLKDLAAISYIPLERTPDNLMNAGQTLFMTGEDIFVQDKNCVQRFGPDGRFRNKIGRQGRGPGELAQFIDYMVDTTAREVFMFDNGQQKTVVFDYDGKLLREFGKADPVYKGGVERVGEDLLIVGCQLQAWGDRPMVPGRLFALISREDGKERERVGPYISEKNGRKLSSVRREYIRSGDEVIVCHQESDTIYSFRPFLSDSLVFESRYILTPPHFCTAETLYNVEVLFETDTYGFLSHVKVDLSGGRISESNVRHKILMADKRSGEIFEPVFRPENGIRFAFPASANKDGVAFSVIQPYILMESLEKGEIKDSQLKQIAEHISEESNPVLMIFSFKK